MNLLIPYLARWNSLNRSRYYQIVQHLAREGNHVYILQPPAMKSMDTGFVEINDAVDERIHLINVDINPRFWNMRLPLDKIVKKGYYCLKINSLFRRLIQEFCIDAILIYNMALYPMSKVNGVATLYDLGDDHIDLIRHELGMFSNPLILGLATRILTATLKRCDCVYSVSHYLSEKYFPESRYLPNGVDIEDIHPGSGESLRRSWQRPVIGFIGSLEYFISFDQIMEAAAQLPDCTFVIAGGGRQYEWIMQEKERLGLGNLVVTGGLPHAEILRYVDSFDICLNLFKPSPLTDGACPIKLFEYMAFQKPIISSRIQEVQRIGNTFLYWADTTEEMISRIKEIVSDPAEAHRRVGIGYDVLENVYTWRKITHRIIHDLRGLLKHGNDC